MTTTPTTTPRPGQEILAYTSRTATRRTRLLVREFHVDNGDTYTVTASTITTDKWAGVKVLGRPQSFRIRKAGLEARS